jgi:hypothetical protein
MEAIKPGLQGEHEAAVKTIAQGMPAVPAEPVVTAACYFYCRRAMGAACIRHSLRPLICWRDTLTHHPGRGRAAGRRRCVIFLCVLFLGVIARQRVARTRVTGS